MSKSFSNKTGTSNELRDSWFAGIDGNQVAITWVGRDNNGPSKLWGSTGALVLYGRYLENGTPQPLDLQMPEGISTMNIDGSGNFVCGNSGGLLGGSGAVRSIPVWTDSPDAMCQASVSAVQQQQQQQIQQQQQQQQPSGQQQQQPQDEKKDSNGVAGWIKDMFGSGN